MTDPNTELILYELRELREKVDTLENKLDKTSGILENHIGFIHKVFDTIKKSFIFYNEQS
jgi:hypothetical protein